MVFISVNCSVFNGSPFGDPFSELHRVGKLTANLHIIAPTSVMGKNTCLRRKQIFGRNLQNPSVDAGFQDFACKQDCLQAM